MAFFDPPAEVDESEWLPPATLSTRDRTVGGVVPEQLVLAESDRAAVVITEISASPLGFCFTRVALARNPREGAPLDGPHLTRHGRDSLRFGVKLADGAKVIADEWSGDADTTYTLLSEGGSGGSGRLDDRYRLTPLPAGDVLFACAWPALDLAESFAVLAGAAIATAAASARTLWADDPDPEGDTPVGGSWTSGRLVARHDDSDEGVVDDGLR